LIANYVILSLLPLIIIGFFIVDVYSRSMMAIAEDSARRTLTQVNLSLEGELKKYENHLKFMAKDQQIRDFLKNENMSEIEVSNLQTLLNGYSKMLDNIEVIGLANHNEKFFSNEMDTIKNFEAGPFSWYRETVENPQRMGVFNYPPGMSPFQSIKIRYTDSVSLCMAVLENDESTVTGVINILLSIRIFDRAMQNIAPATGGFIYVTNAEGKVVYSQVVQSIPEPKNKSEFRTLSIQSNYTGWTVWGVIPIRDILNQINSLKTFIIVVFACMIAVFVIVAFITSNSIVRPIGRLRDLMRRAEEGDLNIRFDGSGRDEVHDLGISFNLMIDKIRQLLQQVYQEQRDKRKAEIAALQSNIKPHFMYNTLDTIHWMCKKYKADDIMYTVDALATLFRIGLSKGKDLIPLPQEIEHVRSYLLIQKVCYEDILEYKIDVPEELNRCFVRKLILQPLVENALYHGIKESGRSGNIRISGRIADSCLKLCVEDDGVGMTEAELGDIRNNIKAGKKGKGYGMLNIHQRLVLSYGQEYGISIFSEKNKGTTVVIRHPLVEDGTVDG